MNENKISDVPYIVYESAQTRMERTNKRLVVALILAIILIFASNMIWLHAWCQYDYESEEVATTYQQDGEGYNNINTGEQGDVNNGADIHEGYEEAKKNPER